ncbi:MAG: CheR family methyltransferase [Gammaproteobacteria bacterium]
MFNCLKETLIPQLCDDLRLQCEKKLRCWSAGCARGEEAYSLVLVWKFILQERYPEMTISVTATDIDPEMIRRAQNACYAFSSLKNLSPAWRQTTFELIEDHYCLRQAYRIPVAFRLGDVENAAFAEPYHLVCCRNLVFTYFSLERQALFLSKLWRQMTAGGVLVLGAHESLPEGSSGWRRGHLRLPIYLRE